MTDLEVVFKIRERLADPAQWTKGYNARNKVGRPANPLGPEAACWCLHGALMLETYEVTENSRSLSRNYERIRALMIDILKGGPASRGVNAGAIGPFNDKPETTHSDVMGFLDNVIRHLGGTP